ncbi:retrovirus-related pol polyprotein from transposon TNT 1-94 [Tanacetum coccineum]
MMGEMKFFLELQIQQSSRGIFINQSTYALEIIKKYGIELCDRIGFLDTRKSKSGGTQFLGEKLVRWSLKKQDCTDMSTTEAESLDLLLKQDNADLEVPFRRNTCFVRNLEDVDLLSGTRGTNLYTINLNEMTSSLPICLMTRAASTKSWLRHRCLSHLNFDTINKPAKYNLVTGLPKFKYTKDHLCPSCEQRKSKRITYKPKPVPSTNEKLHMLHMDLCGPMRAKSINGKKYIVLKAYFENVGITHYTSMVRTPQQNVDVERRNLTLVEAARTLLIFSKAPLYL